MAKIQITELNNSNPSKIDSLSEAETAEVFGGRSYYYPYFAFDFSAYIGSKFNVDIDLKDLKYIGKNGSYNIAIGGKKYSFISQYKQGSNSHNYAFVHQ